MIRMVQQCRAILRDYCQTVSAEQETSEFVSAILFVIGTLALGMGAAAIIGGSNG